MRGRMKTKNADWREGGILGCRERKRCFWRGGGTAGSSKNSNWQVCEHKRERVSLKTTSERSQTTKIHDSEYREPERKARIESGSEWSNQWIMCLAVKLWPWERACVEDSRELDEKQGNGYFCKRRRWMEQLHCVALKILRFKLTKLKTLRLICKTYKNSGI